ncbi:MAG: methylated-DNA--[protein]-cysteine S-methyltransferase [Rhizobiaceae bacterium]
MAVTHSHHLFETALGWVGIAWSDQGITRLLTPQRERQDCERRLMRLAGSETVAVDTASLPKDVADAVALLTRYAAGETIDFSPVNVDLEGIEQFRLDIYDAARKLKFGETVTYGQLAAAAGHPGEARDTGQALGANPVPIVVPCHRILAAGGKIGGFSAPGGSRTKEKLLALEGVHVGPPPPAQSAFGF